MLPSWFLGLLLYAILSSFPGVAWGVQVACGGLHTCAIVGEGRLKCWGDNGNGQIGINLYDPFGFGFRDKPADKRARGLKSEILNGRAAMFGIMGFLAESKVPGSVPILSKISGFPHYDGDVMAPFAPEIHLNF